MMDMASRGNVNRGNQVANLPYYDADGQLAPTAASFGAEFGNTAKTQAAPRVLDAQAEAEAMNWYVTRGVNADLLKRIQAKVNTSANGVINADTVHAVAVWQRQNGLDSVDGEFGPKSAKAAGDERLYGELKQLTDDYRNGVRHEAAPAPAPQQAPTQTETATEQAGSGQVQTGLRRPSSGAQTVGRVISNAARNLANRGNVDPDSPTGKILSKYGSTPNGAPGKKTTGGKPIDQMTIDELTVDKAVIANDNFDYDKATWKNIQRKAGLTGGAVDGILGSDTTKAVAKWQLENGLINSGIANATTLAAMGIEPTMQAMQKVPTGATGFMDNGYTPNLKALKNDAATREPDLDVSTTTDAAKYIARRGTSSSSLGQCTRGTALFLELASFAKGEARKTYKQACKASEFGSKQQLTSFNISSSVAGEYSMSGGTNIKGRKAFDNQIKENITKDGEFVTFDYTAGKTSFHIVFYADGKWYSDFKQNSASGINAGDNYGSFYNIHYFKK